MSEWHYLGLWYVNAGGGVRDSKEKSRCNHSQNSILQGASAERRELRSWLPDERDNLQMQRAQSHAKEFDAVGQGITLVGDKYDYDL